MTGRILAIAAIVAAAGSAVPAQTTSPANSPTWAAKLASLFAQPWTPINAETDAAATRMRLILTAIAEYDTTKGALPTTLGDLETANLIPAPDIFHDPRTNSDDGFVYVKPQGANRLSDIASPAQTAILYEKINGKPDPAGVIGYANGFVDMPRPPATQLAP